MVKYIIMPGGPAVFTQETVILVYGGSGSGKTTLCNFMDNGKGIKHVSIDKFFSLSFIKECGNSRHYNKVEINEMYNYLDKYDNPSSKISQIMNKMSSEKVLNILSNIICMYINRLFHKNKEIKIILLEGQPLFKLNEYIKKKLKYNIWETSRLRD